MPASFPWPVTDEELLLNNALERTLAACEPRGANEAKRIRDAAANLIVEAYNQGVRDEEHLANYALKALKLKRTG
jgi:hypothetical protein